LYRHVSHSHHSPSLEQRAPVCDRIYDIILKRCHVIIFNFPLLSGAEKFFIASFPCVPPSIFGFSSAGGGFAKPQHVINHLGWCRKPLAMENKNFREIVGSERLKVGQSSLSPEAIKYLHFPLSSAYLSEFSE
jgi:hypothetical protein